MHYAIRIHILLTHLKKYLKKLDFVIVNLDTTLQCLLLVALTNSLDCNIRYATCTVILGSVKGVRDWSLITRRGGGLQNGRGGGM